MRKVNLLRTPVIQQALASRWLLVSARALALGGFVFVILAGLLGTPVGNHNFAIVAVWIAWWAGLILVIVPFFGRGWCAVCPIPIPGEWIQNGAILGPGSGRTSLSARVRLRQFPKALRNIWFQNAAFTALALFSAVILTRPAITAWLLLWMILVAVALSLIYERRAFCRYVCPVGGFIGMYSQLAPLELRVIDSQVCKAHKNKSCYQGNGNGYGCPWILFPGGNSVNTNCGLCMECLRTCEYNNIAVNLRSFGSDLISNRERKLDEAYKAFIMLGSALAYSAVMLGPWGGLKNAAYQIGSLPWMVYAVLFLTLTWGVLPALFYLATRISSDSGATSRQSRQTFTTYSAALLPLGLMAWMAFSFSFVFANISYLWPTLSDPFGWGWDLLGTAAAHWTPYLSKSIPTLQTIVLLGGFLWAGDTASKIAAERNAPRQAWAVIAFCGLVTSTLLWLLVG